MEEKLLTLAEAADRMRLRSAESFARFAQRHQIPIVRIGARVVRVRPEDLERVIREHTEIGSSRENLG